MAGKAPRFTQKPKFHQLDADLLLECILEGSPAPKISWLHDGAEVKGDARHIISPPEELEPGKWKVTMEILEPDTSDSGNYKCNAKNDLGESNATILLDFNEVDEEDEVDPAFPQWAKPPTIRQVGDNVHFEGRATSISAITSTEWFFEGKLLKQSARHNQICKKEGNEYLIRLEVENPQQEDGGKYRCVVKNAKGEVASNLTLDVKGNPKGDGFIKFVSQPTITPAKDLSTCLLECHVKAKPKPTVSWFNDEESVTTGGRIKLITKEEGDDVYALQLQIASLQASDAGVYRCRASNSAGNANANLTLNIECKLMTMFHDDEHFALFSPNKLAVHQVYQPTSAKMMCY